MFKKSKVFNVKGVTMKNISIRPTTSVDLPPQYTFFEDKHARRDSNDKENILLNAALDEETTEKSKMLNNKAENHNNANNINMDGTETNTFIKKSNFVHINIKLLSICVTLVICILLFNSVLFAYKYYNCKSSHEVQPEIVEWAQLLRSENHTSGAFNGRLPTNIVPVDYHIKIVPYLIENNFTFEGEVRITLAALESTNSITLHINELDIQKYSLVKVEDYLNSTATSPKPHNIHNHHPVVNIAQVIYETHNQFVIFKLADGEFLQPEYNYELSIKYTGRLNNNMKGLYRSSYTADNTTRWIVVSQFQPTDARRAFPCFDEPALKAVFYIFLGRTENMTTLSNAPLQNTVLKGVHFWDIYQPTPKMSTYLVAMAFTDFSFKNNTDTFRVWSRNDFLEQTTFSLEIGPKLLNFYAEYFNFTYPSKKTDMIALPDFNAGAMENFGLITYRENSMLYDSERSTNFQKERVATVVSHELAHQWFGNLVTLDWWNDLWLNEGFASYIEYLGVDSIEKSWNMIDIFVVDELQNVFFLDALKSSHPVQAAANNPNEILELFDKISYSKGASLLRMVDHILTKVVLREGLKDYIKEKAFDSATQEELWGFLTKAGHKFETLPKDMNISIIMHTWTHQTGFPVITVTRNYEQGGATIEQKRFLLETLPSDANEAPLWWVPLTINTHSHPAFNVTIPSYWLRAQRSLTLERLDLNAKATDWIILNSQETGFYRVQYDERNWRLIIATLRDPEQYPTIHVLNRAQLVDDAMNLARAGLLDYHIALNVTSYLKHESDLVPWRSAMNAFAHIETQMYRRPEFELYKKYLLHLMDDLYQKLGFNEGTNEDQLTIYKRVEVITKACLLGHTGCVEKAIFKFKQWIAPNPPSNIDYIPPNLKSTVLCTGIRMGTSSDWEILWEKYTKLTIASEKDIYLSALACSSEYSVLARYLDLAITENSPIRKQDVTRVFSTVSQSPIGHTVTLDFLFNNWDRIKTYFNGTQFQDMTIIRFCTKRISSEIELRQLQSFIQENRKDLGGSSHTMLQIIENAETNVNWSKKNYKAIVNWLKKPENYKFHTKS